MEGLTLFLPWFVAVVIAVVILSRPKTSLQPRGRSVALAFGVAILGLIAAWLVAGTLDERTCGRTLHALGLSEGGGWISLHCLTLMLRSIGLVGVLLCGGLVGVGWRLERTRTDGTGG